MRQTEVTHDASLPQIEPNNLTLLASDKHCNANCCKKSLLQGATSVETSSI
jgi:hypothetical protein